MKRINLVIAISLLVFIGCSKEDNQEPQQPQLTTVTTQIPIKANEKFIGNWIDGEMCGTPANVIITEGPNDSTIVIHGSVLASVRDSSFSGWMGTVLNHGYLIKGNLRYCQEASGVKCCSIFYKQ